MDNAEIESKLIAYGTEFLKSYTDAVDTNFTGALDLIRELGMETTYFPLYARELGRDTALTALFTSSDFYLFFLADRNKKVDSWRNVDAESTFNRDWTFKTPYDIRVMQVKDQLSISESSILRLGPKFDCLNIPGTNFMGSPVESMVRDAESHGNGWGNAAGTRTEADLPGLVRASQRKDMQASFGERYTSLRDSSIKPQTRGQEFEKLWRDMLNFHGWRPKKIRISGEENDFTAIYQGLHILGEVRWFNEPMPGGKMREFLGKLDPRPQTIGLFVSHSGLDNGAWSVVRRAVNSKTVVVFELPDIEAVLVDHVDIGEIFSEKLRRVYDHIFEN